MYLFLSFWPGEPIGLVGTLHADEMMDRMKSDVDKEPP
jgi:hypothetical protein